MRWRAGCAEPEKIFSDAQVTDLIDRIRRFDESAEPSGEHATA